MEKIIIAGKTFLTHSALSYGDYDNSCAVERANVRYLREKNEGTMENIPMDFLVKYRIQDVELKEDTTLVLAIGGYGCVTAYLLENEDNLELVHSLNDYPLFDDDLLFEVEQEMLQADWESWLKHDLLHEAFPDPEEREAIEELEDDVLFECFNQAMEEKNEYYQVHAGGVGYVDIDRIAGTFKGILNARINED